MAQRSAPKTRGERSDGSPVVARIVTWTGKRGSTLTRVTCGIEGRPRGFRPAPLRAPPHVLAAAIGNRIWVRPRLIPRMFPFRRRRRRVAWRVHLIRRMSRRGCLVADVSSRMPRRRCLVADVSCRRCLVADVSSRMSRRGCLVADVSSPMSRRRCLVSPMSRRGCLVSPMSRDDAIPNSDGQPGGEYGPGGSDERSEARIQFRRTLFAAASRSNELEGQGSCSSISGIPQLGLVRVTGARAREARSGAHSMSPERWSESRARYGALTIFSMATPCMGTLVAVYESVEVPRSFWA
jgi:hypothetical protein